MNIAWEEHGDGTPLLLIQGLGYGRWGWDPVVPALTERYRVLTFDNRGIGESDKPEGPYTAGDMAADALQVLDEAGVGLGYVLGASLGGMIAQELVVRTPERVEKLVLCCTTPGGADAYPLPEATMNLFVEAPTLAPEVALRRFVENALGDQPSSALVDEIFARRVANPPDPAGWQAQAAAGTTFAGVDGTIDIPTLVLHGTADKVVDPRNAELFAERIPGARVELIPDTGHLFFWERPDAFLDLVTEFLG
ncbi:MAG: alpha/beta fold hydrolase [Gaiellaceae bacterium]